LYFIKDANASDLHVTSCYCMNMIDVNKDALDLRSEKIYHKCFGIFLF
jgi:hypothetical protein